MKSKKNIIYLAIVAVSISACSNHAESNFKASTLDSDTVSVKQAKIYVANYASRAGFVDSTYTGSDVGKIKKVPDTRCIWFGINRLENLVKKIKAEGGDGIRFYYASYDSIYNDKKKYGAQKPPRPYWGHNTMIMVSTKDSLSIYHRDYYNNLKDNQLQGSIIMTVPENRGELCPPPSPCNGIGATLINN